MANLVVIGATGDVGAGIVSVLLGRGHRVVGVARDTGRLGALVGQHASTRRFQGVAGSLESDEAASELLTSVRAAISSIDGVVVAINAPRVRTNLSTMTSREFAQHLRGDLVAHFTAVRTFAPALRDGGIYIGIGGGSADFLLEEGAHMSVAQAALRMMHRAFAHEFEGTARTVKQLTIASVVNGATTRLHASPAWVTDIEIGEQVARMLEAPDDFPQPVWRIARRDETGQPVISHEGETAAANRPLVSDDLTKMGNDGGPSANP